VKIVTLISRVLGLGIQVLGLEAQVLVNITVIMSYCM